MSEDRIEALRRAVEASPGEHTLRLMLAEALHAAGRDGAALVEYETLLHHGAVPPESLVSVGQLAADSDRLDLVRACVAAARESGVIEGLAELQRRADAMLAARGAVRVTSEPSESEGGPWDAPRAAEQTTFAQVGGMDQVKQVIHRMIILPLSRPELYAKYGRRTGGGVLLYGPPGCGKTLLARATAGECGLPFLNVRIEDIMDPYLGVSERNLHQAFEAARAQAPSVLFLDELDALAYARHKQQGSHARRLVDVLLQELDSIGSDNQGVLMLAATNAPWDVDEAMQRPGRYDRMIFVPPPDEPARRQVAEICLREVPTDGVDLADLARRTPLFSGADLRAVVERATDEVIEEALRSGQEPPLRMSHLDAALASVRPTTLDWLARARAYVEFANQSERYADVAAYLRTREVRRRLAQ